MEGRRRVALVVVAVATVLVTLDRYGALDVSAWLAALAIVPGWTAVATAAPAAALVIAHHVACTGVGYGVLRLLSGRGDARDEPAEGGGSLVVGWLVGVAAAGTTFFSLAALGVVVPALEVLWLVGGFAVLIVRRDDVRAAWAARAPLPWTLRLATGALALPVIVTALAPPLSYDAGVYHLGLLEQAELWGRAPVSVRLCVSSLPMGVEYAAAPLLWLTDDARSLSLHFVAILFGTLACVARAARAVFREEDAARLVWPFGLAMPVLLTLTAGLKPDLFLCAATAVGVAALVRPAATPTAVAELLLACAAGASAKLPFGVTAIALLVVAGWRWRASLVGAARTRVTGGALLLAALLTAPPYLRNLLELGNPIYPFLAGLFDPASPGARVSELLGGQAVRVESLADALALWRLPWDLTFVVRDGNNNNLPGGLWLLGAAALALQPRARGAIGVVLLVVAAVFVPWQLTYGLLRFAPAVMVLMLLVAAGGVAVLLRAPSPDRRVHVGATILLVGAAVVWTAQAHEVLFRRPLEAARGVVSARAYLERELPPYGAYRFLGENVPEDAIVYSMSDLRVAWLPRRVVLQGLYARPHWVDALREAAGPDDVVTALRATGATLLLVDENHLRRVREAGHAGFDEAAAQRLRAVLASLPRVYDDGRFAVLSLAR